MLYAKSPLIPGILPHFADPLHRDTSVYSLYPVCYQSISMQSHSFLPLSFVFRIHFSTSTCHRTPSLHIATRLLPSTTPGIHSSIRILSTPPQICRIMCGVAARTLRDPGDSVLWTAFLPATFSTPPGGLPQVYRAICGKVLVLCVLWGMVRFTCGDWWWMDRPEKHLWGRLAPGGLPQVYHAVCGKALIVCGLRERVRFTCGGISVPAEELVYLRNEFCYFCRKILSYLRLQ